MCRNGAKLTYVMTILGCLFFGPGSAAADDPGVYTLTLNGLEIGLDRQTGGFLSLSYPDTGTILKASSHAGGLLDLAYPVDSFLPMRLASRFSRAAFIKEAEGVTIRWNQLGPSRSQFVMPLGEVKAAVTVRAAPDKRSVILNCRIENRSSIPIPQVMFPDLWGLKPLGGIKETQLRLARGVAQPFQELSQPSGAATMYAGLGWKEYAQAP